MTSVGVASGPVVVERHGTDGQPTRGVSITVSRSVPVEATSRGRLSSRAQRRMPVRAPPTGERTSTNQKPSRAGWTRGNGGGGTAGFRRTPAIDEPVRRSTWARPSEKGHSGRLRAEHRGLSRRRWRMTTRSCSEDSDETAVRRNRC